MKAPMTDAAAPGSPSDDTGVRPSGSFFGRRKGHRLRAHQADLIEQLLPRLALDIGVPSPPDVEAMFDPRADAVQKATAARSAHRSPWLAAPSVPLVVRQSVL